MKKSNYIVELTFLGSLLLVAVAFFSQLLETENDPMMIVDAVEYARVIVGLFFIGILVVGFQTIRAFAKYLKENPIEPKDDSKKMDQLTLKLVIATGFILFFYCYFMQKLGYYATGFIVLNVYQLILTKAQDGVLTKKSVFRCVAIAVAVTAVLFLVFSVAFELYLPRGILR